jgi:glycerol-3-phosphate acyltransferase PlsX
MRLAIDAMGGDYAPKEIVAGAVQALEVIGNDDRLVLIGQEDRIRAELASNPEWKNDPRLEIVHTKDVVEMGDHPVEALRQKRDNSISRMAQMAADGEVQAVISAGNTGACVAACQMKIRPIKGINRPGIAVVIPSFAGPIIMCDVGANPMPKPHQLHEYALMASIYHQCLFHVERPRVALLNIGEEDDKGSPMVRQVRDLIKSDPRLNYVGYVEGRTLLSGAADVVVCDGFVGNVVLKLIEGLTDGLTKALFKTLEKKDPKAIDILGPVLKEACQQHDYSEHGGAPLIGVDGICIICHGVSDRRAIKNAVVLASKLAKSNVNQHIVDSINSLPNSSVDCASHNA